MAERDSRHRGGKGHTDAVRKGVCAAWRRKTLTLLGAGIACAATVALAVVAPSWAKERTPGPREHRQANEEADAGGGRSEPPDRLSETTAALDGRDAALRLEAVEAVIRLVKDFPDSVDPLGLMGNLYVSLGQTGKAVKCWERCIELDPTRIDSYRCIAEAALQGGQFAKAEAMARRALRMNPLSPGLNGQLGRALVRLGKPREAVAALQRDVKISPGASLSYLTLGHAYQQLAEYQKAKDSFVTALRIDPAYTEACYGVAVACARLGQKDEAARYRRKFKQMKAEDWKKLPTAEQSAKTTKSMVLLRQRVTWTHTQVGIVYYERGRLAEAEKHWLRAAALDPQDTNCRHELASLYQKTRQLDKALEICQQLLRIKPESVNYHIGHSVLLSRLNRIDAALAAVERAIRLDPRNAAAWRQRKQILKKKNR